MTKKKETSKKPAQNRVKKRVDAINNRRQEFLSRRPHRSFRLTRRRDYKRSLKVPGYWALTAQVGKLILKHKRVLLTVALLYAVLMVVLSSFVSQETYSSLQDLVNEANEGGALEAIVPTATLLWGVVTAQLSGSGYASASSQQAMSIFFGLMTWLSTIWLLRSIMAGKKPRARDGIYSSGGPVVPLLVLCLVFLIQLIPAAIAVVAYNAAATSGLFDQTAVLMLFGIASILLITLSAYWVTSTLVAMVIVTLPGMYPFEALRLAGDLTVGRRTRFLLRLLWMIVLIALAWIVVLVPAILIDGALKSAIPVLDWLPLVPITALLLSSLTIVVAASYVYVFYRKVVEDDSAPA